MAGGVLAWKRFRKWAFEFVADRDTGEQRRRAAPFNVEITKEGVPGSFDIEAAESRALRNERGFFTLRDGRNIFYQTWSPFTGEVKGVVIFFHGFGDHSDFLHGIKAKAICNLGPFATAGFDLPGHGRSDGRSVDIPDWLAFVDSAQEVVVEHLRPLITRQWNAPKVFGFGESMGGGVLFTLLVREKNLFDGAVLICPMLFVSRDMFPPWLVVQLFKHVLANLLPLWPIAPNKKLDALCNSDPAVLHHIENTPHDSFIRYRAQPRLSTAITLAFNAGEWMQKKIVEFDTPALIIHGQGDRVTDHRVTKELFANMKHSDKEFLYPQGCWHSDLFHGGPRLREENRERFDAVVTWLEKRCL